MSAETPSQPPPSQTPQVPSSPGDTGPGQTPPPPSPPAAPPPPPPYYQAPPPRRNASWLWGCVIGAIGCLGLLVLFAALAVFGLAGTIGGMGQVKASDAEIALIRVQGVITAGGSGFSPFGGQTAGSDAIVDQIERAASDKRIKAIVLRVNSPGGSAAASQEIYNALRKARKDGVKVVVSMADVAASGGYYISAPADKIYVNPATLTGSIGVIAMHQDLSGLLEKVGIEAETIKSGELKDMLSPFAPLSDDARTVMTRAIMQVYDQFVKAVAEGRSMSIEEVKSLADGRIYTGQQAVDNGLADELGGLSEALQGAMKLSGARSAAYREYGAPPALLKWLLDSQSRTSSQALQTRLPGGLLYDPFVARLVWGQPVPEPPAP